MRLICIIKGDVTLPYFMNANRDLKKKNYNKGQDVNFRSQKGFFPLNLGVTTNVQAELQAVRDGFQVSTVMGKGLTA